MRETMPVQCAGFRRRVLIARASAPRGRRILLPEFARITLDESPSVMAVPIGAIVDQIHPKSLMGARSLQSRKSRRVDGTSRQNTNDERHPPR
jgi:hypothetical protein